MTTNTANNINTARRLANSAAKAEQILKEGYRFEKDADSEVIAVIKPGRLAASYWLNMLSEGCDCPDYLKNGSFCKHTIANGILEDEEASLQFQCELYDNAECANGVDYLL
jgi:SWIM zinc finger